MPELKAAAIVLAAGKGTRMKSNLPKVLHRIGGRTLIGHVLDCLAPLGLARIVAVIAPGMDAVEKEVAPHGGRVPGRAARHRPRRRQRARGARRISTATC